MPAKIATLDFSKVDGGNNLSASDPLQLKANEVQGGTINAQLLTGGPKRWPGSVGLSSSAMFAAILRGMHGYLQKDATDKLLALSGGKWYDVSKSTGTKTERFDLTGTGEGSFGTYKDKAWLANGTKTVKLENNTAYQVGISAPAAAGGSSAVAGGSLPDGAYQIKWGYVRVVSGVKVLFSQTVSEAEVTTSGTDNTIRLVVTASADAQVTNIAVWMTDADLTTPYRFFWLGANTTGNLDVTGVGQREADTLESVEASINNIPDDIGPFENIAFHVNRLWGTKDDTAYYSLEAGTAYDLERFPSENTITYPFKLDGHFSLGDHIYFNTVNGLIRQPNGDPQQEFQPVTEKFYFLYIGTVQPYKTGVIGLTNLGVRIFDGVNWTDDLSKKIHPEILKMINANDSHKPRGQVFKRSNRTEYHLTYMDTTVSSAISNITWVLNLDKVFEFLGPDTAWEKAGVGAEYMVVDNSNVFFHGQSVAAGGHIYKEDISVTYEKNIYDNTGVFQAVIINRLWKIVTRKVAPSLTARSQLFELRLLARMITEFNVNVVIDDRKSISDNYDMGDLEDAARYGIGIFGVSYFTSSNVDLDIEHLSRSLKGYTYHLEITQTTNDVNLLMQALILRAVMIESNSN